MMKLFKKLLAVAMVAVLALTVLTGMRYREQQTLTQCIPNDETESVDVCVEQ